MSLVGCSPWGGKESDMTEQLHFHFSLSCVGEGNGNPLQCSCLENPRDGEVWWAAVYGVAQSRTRLMRLSSSSSSSSLPTGLSILLIFLKEFLKKLSSPVACGILVPDQGSIPRHPLQWKHGVLTSGSSGKSLDFLYCFCFNSTDVCSYHF